MKYAIWLLGLLSFTASVFAQADCPSIVQAALQAADSACNNLRRNQVCYGNIHLTATPRDETHPLTFEKTGDTADIANVKTLQLSSLSLSDDAWGVALMKVQANLPDTLPGENVTVLLFGDVEMDNAAKPLTQLKLTIPAPVNVRLRPSKDAKILQSFPKGQTLVANGRLADSSWIRVLVDDAQHDVGWVSAEVVRQAGDLSTLTVVTASEPVFGPMQAFTFRSGVGDRPCETAPDSGILIQTPKGRGKVILNANDVELTLGSTVYLQAQPGSAMTVSVIEGGITLDANGSAQTVPAGTFSSIPLDSTGQASGAPTYPQPYNAPDLATLPLSVLPIEVEVAPALATNNIPAAVQTVQTEQAALTTPSTATDTTIDLGHPDCGATALLPEVKLYAAPSKSSAVIMVLHQGATIVMDGRTSNGWYRGGPVNGVVGNPTTWIPADEVQLVGTCHNVEQLP